MLVLCVPLQRIGAFGRNFRFDFGNKGVLVFTTANDLAMSVFMLKRHDGADYIHPSQFGAAFAVGNFRHRHQAIQPFGQGSARLLQKPGNVGVPEVLHAAVNFPLGGLDVLIGKNAGTFS